MQVKPSQVKSILAKYLRAGLVPMLTGSPGEGKSSLIKDVAKEFNLKVIDVRLSQCDPTDLLGMPTVYSSGKAGYLPMDTFPIEGDEIPDGYSGWLLFLDEAPLATDAVIAAAYKLVLDKEVGQKKLHKNVAIILAGNLETDNAMVNPMSTAMQSRLCHIQMAQDYLEWVDWAVDSGIDHRITDFIKYKPDALYAFKPDHSDHTFGSPRTWEFTHKILKVSDIDDPDTLPMIAGAISEGLACEFTVFCKIYKTLAKIEDIIKSPDTVPVPNEPSVLFALTGTISQHAKENNIGDLMIFVNRLPIEFQVVTLREVLRKTKNLISTESVKAWVSKNATELF